MRRSLYAAGLAAALSLPYAPATAIPTLPVVMYASDNVEYLATIPDALGIGAKIVDDYLYVTTLGGVRIYDVSAGVPVLTGALELPHWENESVDTNGEILLVSTDFLLAGGLVSGLAVIDVSIKQAPHVVGFAVTRDGHTATCIKDCQWAWTSGGDVVDLRNPILPRTVGSLAPASDDDWPGGHNWNLDDAEVAWISGEFGYDTSTYPGSDPTKVPLAAFGASVGWHNSMRPDADLATPLGLGDGDIDPGEVLIGASEDYLNDVHFPPCVSSEGVATGWIKSRGSGQPLAIERLDSWRVQQGTLPSRTVPAAGQCSAHWFDEHDGLLAAGWYDQGTRILDVSDPRDIRQVGYFVPAANKTWAAYFHEVEDGPLGGGLYVYTMDIERGMDVFKLDATAGVSPTVSAPVLNPTNAAYGPSDRWGWACRIPAGADTDA